MSEVGKNLPAGLWYTSLIITFLLLLITVDHAFDKTYKKGVFVQVVSK